MTEFINSIVVLLNFVIIPGLSYGSQLALGALGVTFVYAILRFANFAHGELMSFGAMITILFTWFFQSQNIGLGILPTALLALPFGILMVEQNAKQALSIADRAYVLVNGKNSREGSGQDLLNNPEVRKSFLGG